MMKYLGLEATIVEVCRDGNGDYIYYLDIDSENFFWCEDLLEWPNNKHESVSCEELLAIILL